MLVSSPPFASSPAVVTKPPTRFARIIGLNRVERHSEPAPGTRAIPQELGFCEIAQLSAVSSTDAAWLYASTSTLPILLRRGTLSEYWQAQAPNPVRLPRETK